MFDSRTARRDLRRYRKRGPGKPTRMLIDALRSEGVEHASLLDIGGGVGAIEHELIEMGASGATAVDASQAYLRAAREEAERRGHSQAIQQRFGDFVEVADLVEPADVVTLDKVICCYPDVDKLVGLSAAHSRRLYGAVYPRDTRPVRAAFATLNFFLRVLGRGFRAYVHPTETVDGILRNSGLWPRSRRRTGPWQVVVYARSEADSAVRNPA